MLEIHLPSFVLQQPGIDSTGMTDPFLREMGGFEDRHTGTGYLGEPLGNPGRKLRRIKPADVHREHFLLRVSQAGVGGPVDIDDIPVEVEMKMASDAESKSSAVFLLALPERLLACSGQ